MRRYAIYWAPPPGTPLAKVAARWLGYDPRTGAVLQQPDLPGLSPEIAAAITEGPRHYGFHATLKPPFELAGGATERDLVEAVERLAAALPVRRMPPLVVAAIDGFLALVPAYPSNDLSAVAEACVRDLDRFRRPLSAAALARDRRAPLTERQERYLAEWGYPFVLEEFRFHLTLTERLSPELMRVVRPVLEQAMAPACVSRLALEHLVVFREEEAEAPMRVLESFSLAPARSASEGENAGARLRAACGQGVNAT